MDEGTLDPDAGNLPPYYRMDLNISKIVSDKLDVFLDIRNLLNMENQVHSVFSVPDGTLSRA